MRGGGGPPRVQEGAPPQRRCSDYSTVHLPISPRLRLAVVSHETSPCVLTTLVYYRPSPFI